MSSRHHGPPARRPSVVMLIAAAGILLYGLLATLVFPRDGSD